MIDAADDAIRMLDVEAGHSIVNVRGSVAVRRRIMRRHILRPGGADEPGEACRSSGRRQKRQQSSPRPVEPHPAARLFLAA
jgi:hypothetical protein